MASEDKSGPKNTAPTPAPAGGGTGGTASQPGPAADSNPATTALGALDATQADDFQPRQAKAAQRAPGTTAGSGLTGFGSPLAPEDQIVRGRGKPGEMGKQLAAADTARYVFDGITIHAPGPDHIPYAFENNGAGAPTIKDGHFQAHEYPPGSVVLLSKKEGDKLVDRHGGRRLRDDENPPGQKPYNVTDHGPQGPEAEEAAAKAADAQRQAEQGFAEGQVHQASG